MLEIRIKNKHQNFQLCLSSVVNLLPLKAWWQIWFLFSIFNWFFFCIGLKCHLDYLVFDIHDGIFNRGATNRFLEYCITAFLLSHFLIIVVEVKALGLPHVLKLWLWVSKGMLHVKYLLQQSIFFVSVKFHRNLASLSFGDITLFKTVVSVCMFLLSNT